VYSFEPKRDEVPGEWRKLYNDTIIIIDYLQKTAILGTSHIIRKVLQAET
jgi:hypothetical protein